MRAGIRLRRDFADRSGIKTDDKNLFRGATINENYTHYWHMCCYFSAGTNGQRWRALELTLVPKELLTGREDGNHNPLQQHMYVHIYFPAFPSDEKKKPSFCDEKAPSAYYAHALLFLQFFFARCFCKKYSSLTHSLKAWLMSRKLFPQKTCRKSTSWKTSKFQRQMAAIHDVKLLFVPPQGTFGVFFLSCA